MINDNFLEVLRKKDYYKSPSFNKVKDITQKLLSENPKLSIHKKSSLYNQLNNKDNMVYEENLKLYDKKLTINESSRDMSLSKRKANKLYKLQSSLSINPNKLNYFETPLQLKMRFEKAQQRLKELQNDQKDIIRSNEDKIQEFIQDEERIKMVIKNKKDLLR
jgi:hypothetical protein